MKKNNEVVLVEITPLGAAIVEAILTMEDLDEMYYATEQLHKSFDADGVCPASEPFSAEQVENYYRERGMRIRATTRWKKDPSKMQ